MSVENDDIFVADDTPTTGGNDFGGDDYEYTPPTAKERGDVLDEGDDEQDDTPDSGSAADDTDDDTDGDTDDKVDESSSDDDAEDDKDDDSESDEEDSEEEEEKPKKKTNGAVPRSRLNKEIQKRRDLENRLRELEAAQSEKAPAPKRETAPMDVRTKLSKEGFSKMQEAMIEGNTEEAFEVFAEMMGAVAAGVRDEATDLARQEAQEEFTVSKTREALASTAAQLAESYPELDHTGDEADEGLIAEVIETRDLYINRGIDPVNALKKAVRIVALDNDLVDRKAAKAPAKKDARIAEAVAKKAQIASKTKGRLGGSSGGEAPSKVNRVAHLSDSDFARTSEEARRRARGDYLD